MKKRKEERGKRNNLLSGGQRQRCFLYSLVFLCGFYSGGPGTAFGDQSLYVGSETCGECHGEEYQSFKKYAKKNHSYDNILLMKKGLRQDEFEKCLECHTTGHGKPGGFVSVEMTPHLKNLGCESCHGPGSLHVESEDPADIAAKLSIEVCAQCHNAERVADFDYKPLIYGGAH